MRWVEALLVALPEDADVLELGCGGGSAATRALARRHRLMGVDLSSVQLERARRAVPDARFVQGDASTIELNPALFDAVVSLFMLGHIPRAEQARLLGRIAGWLRPGGHTLLTLGVGDTDDEIEADWLGAPMFFASFDADRNRAMLAAAGLEILRDRIVPIDEPGHGLVSFQWVLARKLCRLESGAGQQHRSPAAYELYQRPGKREEEQEGNARDEDRTAHALRTA